MTNNENALIAYAILDEVNEMVTNGGNPDVVMRDIARAQVYATLATVPPQPTHAAISDAIRDVLVADGITEYRDLPWAAAEAVGRLL